LAAAIVGHGRRSMAGEVKWAARLFGGRPVPAESTPGAPQRSYALAAVQPSPRDKGIEMLKLLCLGLAVLFGVALEANGVSCLCHPTIGTLRRLALRP
jgi:hypothetical protein